VSPAEEPGEASGGGAGTAATVGADGGAAGGGGVSGVAITGGGDAGGVGGGAAGTGDTAGVGSGGVVLGAAGEEARGRDSAAVAGARAPEPLDVDAPGVARRPGTRSGAASPPGGLGVGGGSSVLSVRSTNSGASADSPGSSKVKPRAAACSATENGSQRSSTPIIDAPRASA
jgi:hypothetical protein